MSDDAQFVPWDVAWHHALYGPDGFYRRADGGPAAHFRTGVHVSSVLAAALARLARQCGLSRVVDLGSGRGELLNSLSGVDPNLALVGVDIVGRPAALTPGAGWTRSPGASALPAAPDTFVDALVVAHEWLDDVPCPVMQVDPAGGWRQVEVDPVTGAERLGPTATDDQRAWLARWWPAGEAGSRAEVGLPRDLAWARLAACARGSVLVAIDYSHDRATRPTGGSLSAYRDGRAVPPVPDGRCDITAHVALDSVARAGEAAGATATVLTAQRMALRHLGVSARRPDVASAGDDPAGYLAGLRLAGESAELLDPGGLGSFGWLIQQVGPALPTSWAGFDSTATGSRR